MVVVGFELLFLVKGLIYRQLLSGPFTIAVPLGWGRYAFLRGSLLFTACTRMAHGGVV